MCETRDAATCQYSACDQPIERQGNQGGKPKLYCSNSCRTRANQERRRREDEQPAETVRRAAIRAHEALDTWQVDWALKLGAVPEDVQRNYLKAREVLAEIVKRIPRTPG